MPTFTEGFETGVQGAVLTPTSLITEVNGDVIFDDAHTHTGSLAALGGGSLAFRPVNIEVITEAAWWTYATGPTLGWFLVPFVSLIAPSGQGVTLALDDRDSTGVLQIYYQVGTSGSYVASGAFYPLDGWSEWTCDGTALTLHRPDSSTWTAPTAPGGVAEYVLQYLPANQVWLDDITFTYEGATPTTFVLRRFPRHDALGFGGTGRNYPRPSGVRNYGGQP